MKNTQNTLNTALTLCTTLCAALLAPSAHAFSVNLAEKLNVSDANLCGDYNQLATYDMSLERGERLPESEAALLTSSNLDVIANELRTHFTVPRSSGALRVLTVGADAGQAFTGSSREDLKIQQQCFGKDFTGLFDFRFENGKFIPKNPGLVTYVRVAFALPHGQSEAATVVIDRLNGRLFIHQEW